MESAFSGRKKRKTVAFAFVDRGEEKKRKKRSLKSAEETGKKKGPRSCSCHFCVAVSAGGEGRKSISYQLGEKEGRNTLLSQRNDGKRKTFYVVDQEEHKHLRWAVRGGEEKFTWRNRPFRRE